MTGGGGEETEQYPIWNSENIVKIRASIRSGIIRRCEIFLKNAKQNGSGKQHEMNTSILLW